MNIYINIYNQSIGIIWGMWKILMYKLIILNWQFNVIY